MSEIEKIAQRLPQEQLIHHLAETAKEAKRLYSKSLKASNTEVEAGLVSRAKGTTLVANSYKATRSYNRKIEEIKIILKYIL